jgi:O-antigen/teichoic acid export membrane protein
MQSTIRSVLVARFAETKNRDDVIAKLSLNFRANALMLGLLAALTLSSAHPILNWLTHGKYADADMLLASLIGILLLDVMRAQLEMFAEVMEQNQWVFAGGFMLLLGWVSTIPLSSLFGMWGLLIGNAIGEILAILLMSFGLKVQVVMSLLSVRMLIFLALLCIFEYVVLLLSSTIHSNVIYSTSVTIITCVVLLWFVAPFSGDEVRKLRMLLRGRSS